MEEADVLGDRIAIMDHGRVICCGTSIFLKRIHGSGYNVHVLKMAEAKDSKILATIKRTVSDVKMKVVSSTQLDFLIKETYVERFPNLLADLENFGTDLGITGISLTSASLEDVFLNVAEESEVKPKEKNSVVRISNYYENEEGVSLCMQRLKAVTTKRLIHVRRKWFSYSLRLIISSIIIFYVIYTSNYESPVSTSQDPLLISLGDIYPDTVNPVKVTDSTPLKDSVIHVLTRENAGTELITGSENINDFVKHKSKEDFLAFLNKILLGITVSPTELVVQYQEMLNIHIPAIAVNLIPNILMSSQNLDGSIKVINHPFVLTEQISECPATPRIRSDFYKSEKIKWNFYIFLAIIICLPGYTYMISEELSSAFKHQQMLAGLSPLMYWFSNLVFDMLFYVLTVSIWIILIVAVGYRHILIDNHELTLLMISVLLLSSLSTVSFLYLLTYIIRGGSSGIIIMVLNVILLVMTTIIYDFMNHMDFSSLMLLLCVCSLCPTFATAMSVLLILERLLKQYVCRVCEIPEECKGLHKLLDMPTENDRKSILIFVILLAALWIPYLLLILLLDSNICRKVFSVVCRLVKDKEFRAEDDDEDVKKEVQVVKFLRGEDVQVPLLVDRLVKKYLFGPKAVDGVSFFVKRGECFGLLGVNGAGKTTTFKMLTGEILPSSGDAEIENVSVFNREYIQLIGYCPQFDACLKDLTGRETLKIIAMIRGVNRIDIDAKADNWLEIMGISEHGNKRTAAYSGGTRRKLCTAMAFMGDPIVVLLDEPTTGVDPVSRRKLWSVIQSRQRAGQAVVLTSHSMEECEALCTRLTIMKEGRMRCIGPVEYLKNKFRLGFVIDVKFLNPTPEQVAQLKRDLVRVFPQAQQVDASQETVQFAVLDSERPLSNIFSEMLRLKQQHPAVQDFVVNNTTLEQLFLSFAQK